ncbi:unnamed protein product, partial [Mesorhabditis belari]|uniref:Plexin domain-containing protein 2 n=1 Tax=Mesorhabditis belari TaxID=2138241 RepID=A0AAF3EBI3_9BILA
MQLFCRCLLFVSLCTILIALDLPIYLRYEDTGPDHILLPRHSVEKRRFRRLAERTDEEDDGDYAGEGWTLPTDVKEERVGDEDHTYYMMTSMINNKTEVTKNWIDVDLMLTQENVTGNRVNLTFVFPFYGHNMTNVTIATGGFLYVGDQTHSWLAATQYIAPLMANFNTLRNGSDILYADDGEQFVCEWRRVQLRGQETKGPFNFQLTLLKSGDITFVYKDVPIPINDISEDQHPVKLGISDAYLYEHKKRNGEYLFLAKRVIYEYHRIEIAHENAINNSVIRLKAQPTCQQFTTCSNCSNATIEHFNCSWCHAKKEHGGPFCTDSGGLHRRRQQWVENNCKDQSRTIYCNGNDDENEIEDNDDSTTSTIASTNATKTNGEKLEKNARGSMGISTLLLLCVTVVATVAWLAYAYYNPHTPSGQLLIKYRPSRWRAPMSHVRYSASVHM